ncbi:MAG: response regulator [Candidatus Saganbacteria bacterium]|nr:response regulator [Candidatus Saganbacteria bacterium]
MVASDGESGLAAAVSKQPDLILLDIRLPKIGGIEVCRKIKSDVSTKKIPIVFLTASQAKGVAEMVKTHGAEDFIIKPFEPAELLAKVRQYLK